MNEIAQELGFDASKALAELQKLNTSLETTQNNLQKLGQAFRDFNSISGQTTRAIAAVSKATANGTAQVAAAANRNLNSATQSVDRFTTSLQLLSRIVFTQFVVSGFGKIKRAIGDSVNSAIEFETQLAEIGTIANGTLGSLNNTGDAVRRISDAFNIPLADSARGLYETLSSQIAEGAKSIEFLEEAAAFAKGTITTTENAVALLSGTLNAFGKSADDAGHVASVFFRTIDLGNVTAEQLTTSFNRTTARARQLGVTFEEVAAAFATMTNRGVAHNEAATQLNAIMTALVKPSEAMTEALRQLGFSSSEVAIQTLGLGGLLKELQQSSGQTAEAMAKLFPNVRGLSGALSLGAQANAQYNDALKEIRDTTSDLSRQKSLDILSTDAQRVAAEMNKLSNLITVDIGQATLKGFANLSQFTGGVDNLTAVVQNAGPVLATGTALLGAYAAAALAGARGNAAFAASFRGVSAGLLLLAGAYSGGDLIGRRLIDAISGPQLEFDRQQREAIKQLEKASADRLRLQREADAERIRSALATTRDLNAAYLADVNNAERAAGLLEKSIGRTADNILRQREGLAQAIRRAGDDTLRFAQQSASRVLGLQDLRDERQFADRTKALTDAQKVFALSQRANELAARAAQQLAAAGGDETAIARAIAQFDRAQATGEAAAAIAERAGNRSLEARAAKALEEVTQRQIKAEQELQRAQQQRQGMLADLDRRQAAILDTVREQAAIIRESSRITGADGQLLDPAEITSRQKAAQAAIERLRQTGFSPDDLRAFDAAGLGDAARKLNMALAGQTMQLQFDISGEVDRIQQTLRASFQRFRVGLHFDVGQLETLLGTTFRSPDDVSRGLSQAAAEADRLRQALAQVGVTEAHIQRLQVGIQGIAAQSDTTSRSLMRMIGFNTTAVSESTALVDSIRQQLVELAQSGSITDAELTSVQQKLATLADQALTSGGKAANIGLATDLNEFSRALGLLIELQQAQQQLRAVDPASQQQLNQLESFLQTLPQAMNAGAAGAERIAAAGAAFEDSVRRGVAALSVAPQGFAFGGAARGIDRIPAMLSPGEFVVNARSSRQFFSQLQAMNAGQQPVYRQDGGNVTNYIGDVVINTNTNQPGVMARDMMRAINRELRRGSGKL